jgi:hypothetical protein
MRIAPIILSALVVGTSLAGCSFAYNFDRAETEVAGQVTGRALREDDDQPASYARVRVQGYGIDKSAGLDGAFSVSSLTSGNWVLDLISDEDGNGWPERLTSVKVRVTTWAPALSVPVGGTALDVPFVDGVPEPIWVALGDVALSGSVALKGTLVVDRGGGDLVSPAEAGYVGRVFVVRDACFLSESTGPAVVGDEPCPTDDEGVDERLTLGAEALSGVDSRGFFGFQGVRPGTFTVVAALYQQGTLFAPLGSLVALSEPIPFTGVPGDVLSPGTDVPPIVLPDPLGIPLDELAPIEINISPSHDVNLARVFPQRTFVIFTPSDAPRPPCTVGVAAGLVSGFKNIRSIEARTLPTDRGFIASLDAPLGSYDVQVCTDIGEGSVEDVVILPARGDGRVPRFGPARVRYTPLCGEDVRDCDDDGLTGLPPVDPFADDYDATVALWRSCAETCATLTTPDVTAATCTVDGVEYDCEDDGDQQADVTENPACYGPGLGGDRDGDGLCDGQDPFPLCASNDPVLCDPDNEPDQTTTLSPIVAEPRCEIGIFHSNADGVCVVEGDPNNEVGCDRVKATCVPRLATTPECFFDDDCADGSVCSRGACSSLLCDVNADCDAGQLCHEGVCRELCSPDDPAAACDVSEQCRDACPDEIGVCEDPEGLPFGFEKLCLPLGLVSEGGQCEDNANCGRGLLCANVAGSGFRCMRNCNPNAARPCPSESQQCCRGGIASCDNDIGDYLCTPFRFEETCLCEDQASGLSVEIDAAFSSGACDAEGADMRWPTCNLFTVYLPADLSWDRPDGGVIDDGGIDAGAVDAGDKGDAGQDDAGVDAGAVDDGGLVDADSGVIILDAG